MEDLSLNPERINCSFISEKVAKIRFVQEKYKQADSFVTGGWGSSTNFVNLWYLAKPEDENECDYVPNSITKLPVDGDVTGLEFLSPDTIVCSTSANNGKQRFACANLIQLADFCRVFLSFLAQLLFINLSKSLTHAEIEEKHRIDNLHKFKTGVPAVCSAISVFDTNIATVGEDGR